MKQPAQNSLIIPDFTTRPSARANKISLADNPKIRHAYLKKLSLAQAPLAQNLYIGSNSSSVAQALGHCDCEKAFGALKMMSTARIPKYTQTAYCDLQRITN